MPEGGDTVFPGDLLALEIVAWIVRDRQFVDPELELGDLCGNFGLEAEAVGLESDMPYHIGREKLVHEKLTSAGRFREEGHRTNCSCDI